MINQNERTEKLTYFCNPDISLTDAIQTATSLGLLADNKKVPNLFMEDYLVEEAVVWDMVESCLSFNTLDKTTLDIIEAKLGTKVALQVYRFYLEKRRIHNLQEKDLIPQDTLLYKMEAVACNETFIDYLLKLT